LWRRGDCDQQGRRGVSAWNEECSAALLGGGELK
jgi:hypothetical protein